MAKKKKIVQESSEDELQQYVVEVISKARVDDDGEWEYFVKWANYDSDNDTWEPEQNVAGCDRLLKGFWKNVGVDDEDYPPGHTVYATPTWIEREKAFFKKHFGSTSKVMSEDEQESGTLNSDGDVQRPSPKQNRKSGIVASVCRPQAFSPRFQTKLDTQGSKKQRETAGKTKRLRSETPPSPPVTKKTKTIKKKKATKQTRVAQDGSNEDPNASEGSRSDAASLILSARIKAKKRATADKSSLSDQSNDKPVNKVRKLDTESMKETSKKPTVDKGKRKAIAPASTDQEESESMGSLFSGSERPSSPDVSLAKKERQHVPAQSHPVHSTTAPMQTKSVPARDIRTGDPSAAGKDKSISSGIPTKMRLAQTAKKVVPTRPAPLMTPKPNLAKLSFKKNIGAASASSTPVQESQPSPSFTNVPSVQSPISMEAAFASPQQAVPYPLPTENKRQAVPLPRRTMTLLQPAEGPASEVDQFLSSIMPTELAASMDETTLALDAPVQRPPPNAGSAPKAPVFGKIPRKWKWSGEAFIDVEEGRAMRLCNVALYDATDPRPNGLRFSLCFTSIDSIRLGKLYDVADIYMVLRSCSSVQQIAKLGPSDDEDRDAVKALARHLESQHAFTYSRLSLDRVEVAMMVVFPPSIAELCKFFKVPAAMTQDSTMVAVLLPWELTRQEYEDARWIKPRTSEGANVSLDRVVVTAAREKFGKDTAVYQALRMLNVPHTMFKFLSSRSQPYCIWHSPADGTASAPGPETMALRVLLAAFRAVDMGLKADVHVIFVHIGALKTLYKLPALAERRGKRFEIRFYTYGTHESVPPDRWGIREIFPLGGIVTFTPSAIVSSIVEIYDFIKKIDEHPLWQCYILPSVIAMLAKLTCQDQGPLIMYDRGEFLFSDLLDMIDDGKISLLRAPPVTRNPKDNDDPAAKWISWQCELLQMNARAILEGSIALAAAQYSNVQENDLPEAIQKEIVRDLMGLQMQPAIMDEFRRFVVIRSKSDRYVSEDKDGIECTTVTAFDFKDDFFGT